MTENNLDAAFSDNYDDDQSLIFGASLGGSHLGAPTKQINNIKQDQVAGAKKSEIADLDISGNRTLFSNNNISPGGVAIKSVEANSVIGVGRGASSNGIIAAGALKSTKPEKVGYSNPYLNVVDDEFAAPDIGVNVKKLDQQSDEIPSEMDPNFDIEETFTHLDTANNIASSESINIHFSKEDLENIAMAK